VSAIIEEAKQRAAALAMPSVRLLRADAVDRARWDAFVQACPEATFFHRAGWQRVIEAAFGHATYFYLAERAGRIEGVLPLARIRSRLFGDALIALPFCVYGGVAAVTPQARAALDAAAVALAMSLGTGHLEYRSFAPVHADDADWLTKDLYVTFRKAIGANDEANLNAIPRKQRAMVRKGIKLGLTGAVDDDVERFFAAYASSVHRLGTPVFAKRYFALLQQEFGADCEVRVILQGETLVAGVLSFFFRDEVPP
jgi:FemAB-related protein (PEP-CTERM system-associated)